MTLPNDPTGQSNRKIAHATSGRAGAVIALGIWMAALTLFEASDFAPIPQSVLVITVIFGGGWLGWRAATFFARRAHERRLEQDAAYRAMWEDQ
ncbi:MAG: hypothetical protein ACPGFA_13490 [Pikeienuella sp.]